MTLPTVPITDDTFVWTFFGNRKWTEGGRVIRGWKSYVDEHTDFNANAVLAKDLRPAIVHGETDGGKRIPSIRSISALVLDCDGSVDKPDLSQISCRYLCQIRKVPDGYKWHLILPFARPWVIGETLRPNQIAERRARIIESMVTTLGVVPLDPTKDALDPSMATVNQITHPYCRDIEGSDVPELLVSSIDVAFDPETALVSTGHRDRRPLAEFSKTGTVRQRSEFDQKVYDAVTAAGLWMGPEVGKGRHMECPYRDEHTDGLQGPTSTMFTVGGRINCFHASCKNRLQPEYWERLPLAPGDYAADIQAQLAEHDTQRVSQYQAQQRIRTELKMARAADATATIIRVSTGAGKTHAAAAFLDDYSKVQFDDEDGSFSYARTSILASPTNALLRETSDRIVSDHKVRVGVLAVLNDDGTPACKKHRLAKELQDRGGNVHRLMCAKCEYREGCPAREGAKRGDGGLTLTNHTLLPMVVGAQAGYPLIVWDECPAMVETMQLKYADLTWLLDRFDMESRPRKVTFASMLAVRIFSSQYQTCLRPLVEVLKNIRGQTLDDAVAQYMATGMSESHFDRAQNLLGLRPAGTPWERICALAAAAKRVHVSEAMLDQMSFDDREAVLRAEELRKALDAVIDPEARVVPGLGCLEVTRLTDNGKVWRDRGGVILDATAPVQLLKSIRSKDTRVVNLTVEDAEPDTRRFFKPAHTISKTALKSRGAERSAKELDRIAADIVAARRDLAKTLDTDPETVPFAVFTYRVLMDELRRRLPGGGWDVWYFGNTRGYDRWYQERFAGFVTVGDPYSNIGNDEQVCSFLGIDQQSYSVDLAKAELAQAHGRARDPQAMRGAARVHLHYGRLVPLGWDTQNCLITPWRA